MPYEDKLLERIRNLEEIKHIEDKLKKFIINELDYQIEDSKESLTAVTRMEDVIKLQSRIRTLNYIKALLTDEINVLIESYATLFDKSTSSSNENENEEETLEQRRLLWNLRKMSRKKKA